VSHVLCATRWLFTQSTFVTERSLELESSGIHCIGTNTADYNNSNAKGGKKLVRIMEMRNYLLNNFHHVHERMLCQYGLCESSDFSRFCL